MCLHLYSCVFECGPETVHASYLQGHADGATTLGNFIRWCNEEGIRVLTVCAMVLFVLAAPYLCAGTAMRF